MYNGFRIFQLKEVSRSITDLKFSTRGHRTISKIKSVLGGCREKSKAASGVCMSGVVLAQHTVYTQTEPETIWFKSRIS